MDYEKKYKEALERFKTFREKYCTYGELHFGDGIFDKTGEAQKDLDAIFPELAESEDERIRKNLMGFLDDVWHLGKDANFDRWRKGDCADWIAYLEKQKEQPTNEEMLRTLRTEYEKGVADTIAMYEQKSQMLKDAVEADVNTYKDIVAGKSWAEFVVEMPTNNLGDKARLIVLPKED